MALCFLFAEEFSNCWWSFSWKTKIILHTQVHTYKILYKWIPKMWPYWFMTVTFSITVCRFVVPRVLPALSGGVLGELWPHTEDSADGVQRPQTDTHTQGELLFHFRIPSSHSVPFKLLCLTYIYSRDSPGRRWSGVLDRCCGRQHIDGFPGERGGWLSGEGFIFKTQLIYWLDQKVDTWVESATDIKAQLYMISITMSPSHRLCTV